MLAGLQSGDADFGMKMGRSADDHCLNIFTAHNLFPGTNCFAIKSARHSFRVRQFFAGNGDQLIFFRFDEYWSAAATLQACSNDGCSHGKLFIPAGTSASNS
jgi:hypothetical protein